MKIGVLCASLNMGGFAVKAKKTKSKKVKQEVAQGGAKPGVEQAATPAVEPMEQVVTSAKPVHEPKGMIAESMTTKDKVMVFLYSVLLFLAMTVQTGRMTMILIGLALVLSIGKTPLKNLRAHLCIPVIGLILFAFINGCAALYSNFGDTAAAELYKIMASFSMAVILLVRFEKKHVRGLLWGFATVCAVIALLCIDLDSWGKLFGIFNTVMERLGTSYSSLLESGVAPRANGIYNDANLTGALLGLAMLVTLYLAHTSINVKERFCALMLLGISAVSFLTAVSRGAILAFAVAVILYLAFEGERMRAKLFFLMISIGVSGMCAGFVALLNLKNQGSIIPILAAFMCGPIAFVLDWAVGSRLSKRVCGHGKAVVAVCGGCAALLVCGVVLSFTLTGPFDFSESAVLDRGVSLVPGEYTTIIDGEGVEEVTVIIRGQTEEQILLGERTDLYKGVLQEAVISIPEGTVWVTIRFFGGADTILKKVVFSNGTDETEIPLKYTILPDMISSRLQSDLLAGSSLQLRLEYFKDGLTLFKEKPIVGHGLGCTEHLLLSVQRLYYETLFIHNHLIQVMDEMGVVGLVIFLMLLVGVLVLLIKRRKNGHDSLAAMLIACWFMMNLHSLIEINFSVRMFQCAAFFLLMIPTIQYANPNAQMWVKQSGYVVLTLLLIQLAGFGFLLQGHRTVQREAAEFATDDAVEFMETMKEFARRDPFDKEQYQLNFVGNAFLFVDARYNSTALKYADELRNSGTYTACSGLARYYYLPLENFEELFACSRQGIAQVASESDAWNLQLNFYRNEVLPVAGEKHVTAVLEGTLELKEYLDDYNTGRLKEISLTEENVLFLSMVDEIVKNEVPSEAAYLILTAQNTKSGF